ncbi:MAG TPA: hypothetical protein VGN80_04815 [Devosiaceae bacterium]|jgi:hypothetical protein|nr:hypothetical protein [Devosiaceae bacterium]
MRYVPLALGLVVALSAATGARAYDCQVSITPDPSNMSYSVIFDGLEGFFAELGQPAECAVSAPVTGLPPGVVAVYTADYRGFLSENSTATMLVMNDGQLVEVTINTEEDPLFGDVFFSDYVGSNRAATAIDSLIALELLTALDPSSIFQLDTIDYAELARTTFDELQLSVDQLATARTALITHLNTTFDLLAGAGQALDGPDRYGIVGGVGSVTLGVNGKMSFDEEFSLLGGLAFVDQAAGGSDVTGVIATGAARYVTPGSDLARPFGEVGLKAAPALSLSFTRSYETSLGTSTATGSTSGSFLGAYVRGGVLIAPDPDNEIVFSASFDRDWLSTAGYEETFSNSNLFSANVPAQTGVFDTVQAGTEWTTRIADDVELILAGAVGRTFARDSVTADIAFAGGFRAAGVSETFVQYGVRASYEIAEGSSVGLFLHGATGAVSGTHAQIGGTFHVRF